jgi:hypothetical protein
VTYVKSLVVSSLRSLLALCLSLSTSFSLVAAQVGLAWDPNPEPDIAGYRVHQGSSSGSYSTAIDVGLVTQTQIPDLVAGECYYYVVTAYNSRGLESRPSNEVRCDIPSGDGSTPPTDPGDTTPEDEDNEPEPPPVIIATDLELTTPEDSPLTIALADVNPEPTATQVYQLVVAPSAGILIGELPDVTYLPFPNYYGPDALEYTISDGALTSEPAVVTLNVLPVNDAPVASPASFELPEDSSLSLTAEALDVDGDPISYLLVSAPLHGTLSGDLPNVTFTPNPDFYGQVEFSFSVSDGSLSSQPAVISLNVLPVNDAPLALPLALSLNQGDSIPFTLPASDKDDTSLLYSISLAPSQGTLSGTAPNLVFTPRPDFHGSDAVSFSVQDPHGASASATVSFSVIQTVFIANNTPVSRGADRFVKEDSIIGVTLFGTDADKDPLTFIITEAPANGVLTGTAPYLYYRPNPDFAGRDRFVYVVSDGKTQSKPAEITISISQINDAPVAHSQWLATPINASLPITLQASDVENDPLTWQITSGPSQGSLSGTAPNLIYTPFPNAKDSDVLFFRAHDGALSSATAKVTIRISPPAVTPVAQSDRLIVLAGSSTSVLLSGESSVLANDQSDPSLATLVTPPTHGFVTLQPNGSFTYHHFGGSLASDSFSYQASNTAGDSDITLVEVLVFGVTALRPDASANALDFPVVPGLAYRVEYQDVSLQSSGLWALLTEFTADAIGIATVTDPGAYLVSQRYYRVSCSGIHGQLVTEPWSRKSLSLSSNPITTTHTFEGSLVRRTTVLATAPNALQLQGPLPANGSLDPHQGFATHLLKVVQSSSPDTQGRTWRIAAQSEDSLVLLTGSTDLSALLQPGDIVEIRRLASLADLLAFTPIADGDVLAVASAHSSPWTAEWVAGSGFWVTADGEQTGPHHASELTLLPTQSLAAHTANLQPLTVHLAGPAPIPAARP